MKSDDDSWHVFRRFSQKDVSLIQYALRRIDKKEYNHLRIIIANKGAMVKEKLDWSLEYLAYKYEKEEFEEDYAKNIGAFGMKDSKANKRLATIMKSVTLKIKNKNI